MQPTQHMQQDPADHRPAFLPPYLDVLPPTTTHEENIVAAGQRRINQIWEYTQACIAVVVVFRTMATGVLGTSVDPVLAVAFGTVVGFYFGRTNHSNTGGVGLKIPNPQGNVER